MPTSRLETFSDGVFAIAITLLVLDFHAPQQSGSLSSYLVALWPCFVAYGISFLLIGLVWANHHSMFVHIKCANRTLMFLNVLLLADVAFLPFPTELLARAMRESNDLQTAAFFYGLVLTIGGVFFNSVWIYAANHEDLIDGKLPRHYIQRTKKRFLTGPLSYGVATLVSFIVPVVSIICYAALIVYFWLPPRGESDTLKS